MSLSQILEKIPELFTFLQNFSKLMIWKGIAFHGQTLDETVSFIIIKP